MTTTPISTRLTLPVLLVLASLLGACGARYAIDTPDGMVTLEEPSWSRYDERATTPHGVVLADHAVAVQAGRRRWQVAKVSQVRFAVLPPKVIRAYVASGEPFGKAGSYAIQGALAGWVAHIDGSHSGIMGLPLFETAQLLRRAGVETSL